AGVRPPRSWRTRLRLASTGLSRCFVLAYELYAFVNLPQRQLGVDFAQRNDGIQPLIFLLDKASRRAPVSRHGGEFLFDEEVDVERRDRQIRVFFFTVVDAARAAGEDFYDDRGLILKRIPRRIGMTRHRDVGVIKPILPQYQQANLGVGVIRLAAL